MDRQFENYLRASETGLEQDQLSELMSAAEPVIRRTDLARLSGRWDDIDDVCSEARLELLLYLRRIKSKPGASLIDDFAAYVGTLARNTCRQYFRRRHPGRARLNKQIALLLQDDPEFKSWQKLGSTWCGRAGCREESRPPILKATSPPVAGGRDLATLMAQLFDAAGGAIEFEDLVNMIARLWHIPPDADSAASDVRCRRDLRSLAARRNHDRPPPLRRTPVGGNPPVAAAPARGPSFPSAGRARPSDPRHVPSLGRGFICRHRGCP